MSDMTKVFAAAAAILLAGAVIGALLVKLFGH